MTSPTIPGDAPPGKKVPLRSEVGTTGLRRTGGFVDAEFLPQLRGTLGYKAYTEMAANDPIIGALLFAIRMLIRSVEWSVEAADDTPESKKLAELVENVLFRRLHVPWEDIMSEACTMFTYGFAPMEVTWKAADDGLHPWKIALRSQETLYKWEFDERKGGEWAGLWQQDFIRPLVYIPRHKLLLFRTEPDLGNPESRSILRNAYVPYVRKKAVEEAEGRAALRAAGVVVVRVPNEVLTDESYAAIKAEYVAMVNNLASDRQGGVLLSSEVYGENGAGEKKYQIEYVLADGRRTLDMSTIVERIDKRIVGTVMADFLLLGQQSVGSFALSQDKTVLFETALWGWLNSMAGVLNRELIRPWAKLNGWDEESVPKLEPGEIRTPNLEELGSYLTALAGVGMPLFPDENLEDYLRRVAGLPDPAPGAEPTPLVGAGSPAAQQGNEKIRIQEEQGNAKLKFGAQQAKERALAQRAQNGARQQAVAKRLSELLVPFGTSPGEED